MPFYRTFGLLVLLGLMWCAVRAAAIALVGPIQPGWALAFWPPSGEALGTAALRASSSPEQMALAREALRRAPLSAEPFVAAARAAAREADASQGSRWLEEAVVRNSRDSDTRRQLISLYWQQGRWSEAIDQGLALARQRSDVGDAIHQSMLLLLDDPRGSAILGRKLAEASANGELPQWGRQLMGAASPAHRRRLQALADLAAAPPDPAPGAVSAEAYAAWVARLPSERVDLVAPVYDGTFRSVAGIAPFEWRVGPGARIEADGSGPGALVASAAAPPGTILARQTLVLPAGTYQLAIAGAAPSGSALTWRVGCPSGRVLVELPLPAADAPQEAGRGFDVPGGCPFQEIALVASGSSREPGVTGEARTRQVEVRFGR
ncbi:hypothetical protein [Sphingosinicella terrae]|uniref:hypothetical protein n=1 Tax=Sphingosinicella terrae TaxID=2172047 RepID=UPI0013B3B58C|nr:hypothetical protein [Sphingosinicella terrae]